MKQPFVIMAKPAGSACNMRCGYCYYLHTGNEKTEAPVMTDEVLEAFIRKYIEASPGPTVSFTWHGGEPTLAGLDFYRRAIALQQKYLPEGWQVWNNLQTNGLLLTEEWCDFIAQNHFDVGMSIDGTRLCHDHYRRSVAGGPTYDQTVASIRRLQDRGVQPDLLCTVNAQTAVHGKEVYHALRDLSTGWMQFIPIVVKEPAAGAEKAGGAISQDPSPKAPVAAGGKEPKAMPSTSWPVSQDSVTPEMYGDFLKDVFSEWFFHDMGRTEVQLFSETARALAGQTPTLCWMAPTCGNVLIVEKDGGIYSCDHFVESKYRIGNVMDDDFQALLAGDFQKKFGVSKRDGLVDECVQCGYLPLCGGGCLKDRFVDPSAAGGVDAAVSLNVGGTEEEADDFLPQGQYFLCGGLKAYFDYAVPKLRLAMQLSGEGKSPEAIMQAAIQKERAKYKGVSRNDLCPCGSGLKFKYCCQKRVP